MEFSDDDCLTKEAAVADFVQDFRDDARADGVRPLSVYLRRYPEAELEVAQEFLELTAAAARFEQDAELPHEQGSPPRASEGEDAELVGGRYRIMELLGRGGQGSVFLAYDERVGRRVALKMLDRGILSSTQRLRLQREATAIASVDHPGIAEVLDARFDGDTPYLAIRFIDGLTLAALFRSPDALQALTMPPTDNESTLGVVRFFASAARAVEAAHEAGFLHRDIKPANLMVHGEESAVVLDFGLALRTDEAEEALTRDGEGVGTPEYMAPEQISSLLGPVNARTDVYGLGATLYEALTGERPFHGTTIHDLEQEILHRSPIDPRARNSALPRDLSVVVQTAMDAEPSRRYASAAALADDLDRVLESKPILARPSGPLVKLHRWAKRQPALAGALSALVVVISIGLVAAIISIENRYALIEQKNEALDFAIAQLLVRGSEDALERNPGEALALAREAFAQSSDVQTRSALFGPLYRTRLAATLSTGSAAPLWGAQFSPDGSRVLALGATSRGTAGPQVELWSWDSDAAADAELAADGNSGTVVSVPLTGGEDAEIFALNREGTDVLLVDGQGTLCRVKGKRTVWTASTEEPLGTALISEAEGQVRFSGARRALSISTGEWSTIAEPAGSAAQAPTVQWVVSEVDEDGHANVEVHSENIAASKTFRIPSGSERIIAASTDGALLAVATAGPDRVCVIDLATGERLVDEAGRMNPKGLAWSQDGSKLLVSSYPAKLLVFRTSPPAELSRLTSTGGAALMAWFAGDGCSAVILREEGTLERWETPLPQSLKHGARIKSPRLLSSCRIPGDLRAWEVSEDKRHLVVAHAGGQVVRFDLTEAGVPQPAGSVTLAGEVVELRFLGANGRRVIARTQAGGAWEWDPARSEALELTAGLKVTAFAATASGDTFFVGDASGGVHVLRNGVESRVLRSPFTDGKSRAVHVLEVSPDGKQLAVGHHRFILRLWSLADLDAGPSEVRAINFSDLCWRPGSDGLVLIYKTDRGGTFMQIDAKTMERSSHKLGRNLSVSSIAFAADSSLFVTAFVDGRAIAFNRKSEAVVEFDLHKAPLGIVATSPLADDPRVITVDVEGGAFLWTLTPEVTAQAYSPLKLSRSLRSSFGLGSGVAGEAR